MSVWKCLIPFDIRIKLAYFTSSHKWKIANEYILLKGTLSTLYPKEPICFVKPLKPGMTVIMVICQRNPQQLPRAEIFDKYVCTLRLSS